MTSEATIGHQHSTGTDALRRATSELLDIDAGALDDRGLHELIVQVQAERARLAVVTADLLAEWDGRRVWESDGSRSAANRLAGETHCSNRTARTEMTRARRIRQLPIARQAIIDGRLSADHLDLLGHINTPERRRWFERDEALLVDKCAELSFADAVRLTRYWVTRTDHDISDARNDDDPEPAAARQRHTASRLHASRTFDDTLALDGIFDPIHGTIIENELHRLSEEIRLADKAAGIERSPAQRRALAMVEMARRSATAPADGRRPQPLFTVLVGEHTLDQLCELSNGAVITPNALLPYLTDALIESVLFDGPTTVIAVSAERTFTGAVRRAIQVRDRRCQHPSGCDVHADHCDVDHIVPVARHGITSQFNGRLQCPAHNRIHRLHDHNATPKPERTITRLDELRARIRWRNRHLHNDDDPPEKWN
jgi:Domain of unknown function (DUF222)